MRTLALDLSLTATGWATSIADHGVYRTGNLRGVERLIDLQNWLTDTLADLGPQMVILEGYAYSRPNQAHQIGEWGGVARWTIVAGFVTPCVELPPATLKKYATGKGNAPKPDMRMALYKRAGLDLSDDNEVDAVWLLAAAHQANGDPLWEMPKANVGALDRFELLKEST